MIFRVIQKNKHLTRKVFSVFLRLEYINCGYNNFDGLT